MRQRALGKGLGALIPEDLTLDSRDIREIKITDIDPNIAQPRKDFNDEALAQLAESIKIHGVVQPIILKPEGDRYVIVAGERRWRAARIAGLKTIPAIVRDYDKKDVMEIALIENLQREDLNPVEEASAIKTLMEEYSLTQEEVSRRIGKSRSAIANILRILHLPERILQYVRTGEISYGHARALLSIEDPELQENVMQRILEEGISVRQVEQITQQEQKRPEKRQRKKGKSQPFFELETTLADILGTRVRIQGDKKKGKIEIEYYNLDDLERIYEILTERHE
jgi:ParB family chromosome partitioning protein